MPADELDRVAAEQLSGAPVDEGEPPRAVERVERVGHALEGGREPIGRLARLEAGAAKFGDVLERPDHAPHGTELVTFGLGRGTDRDAAARERDDLELHVERGPVLETGADRGLQGLAMLGRVQVERGLERRLLAFRDVEDAEDLV